MSSENPGPSTPLRRRSRRLLAIEVAALLLVPVLLGAALGSVDVNTPQGDAMSPVGSEAHDLLNDFPDNHLVVEIDFQSSIGPPPATSVALLEDRINETCSKQSISVEEYPFSSTVSSFSEGALLGLAESVRHSPSSPGTIVVDYLYLDGSDADNPNVLGLAYRGASIAVFAATIQADASGDAAAVTSTVLIHEFGHELGLVGVIGSAPNEDPSHPDHSDDPNDVMYWEVDTTAHIGG